MVGHTHEDVDQSFSLLSRYLHKNSALSMEGDTSIYSYIHDFVYTHITSSNKFNIELVGKCQLLFQAFRRI